MLSSNRRYRSGSSVRTSAKSRTRWSVPCWVATAWGTAVVESLALGTPVVGLSRGCLPELIDHGRTGLLTTDEDSLAELVDQADRIDPAACREEAARRFTPAVMARAYLDLYQRVRETAGRHISAP